MQVDEEHGSVPLGFDNFCGLFLVLAVGCAFGVLFSCVDLAASTARATRHHPEPFSHRFLAELRFVFRFKNSVKPINVSKLYLWKIDDGRDFKCQSLCSATVIITAIYNGFPLHKTRLVVHFTWQHAKLIST